VLRQLLVFITFGLTALSAFAVVDVFEFENPVDRQRYQSFIEEMRCPKCQNQNLAGSDSPIATDLRRELYDQIQAGRSDKEIVDFMVGRYGDYILYKPQLQRSTWVLWFAPLVLFVVGLAVWVMIMRRRRDESAIEPKALSAKEQARLQALLKDDE